MTGESQKFIARNRAPRVQIEYDVELYGSEKKVQLPFVMGVMSDLAGKSEVTQPAVEDRRFLEIDVDNFDERMKAMQPRAAFSVPNTLTGQGDLSIDLTFERMEDFTPAAIAAKIAPLRELLEARTQLSNLATYMDGKTGAEALIERILTDPTLLKALAAPAATNDVSAALESLRAAGVHDAVTDDDGADVLDALRAQAPDDTSEPDTTGDVLAGLARTQAPAEDTAERSAGVLDRLRRAEEPPARQGSPALDQALESLRAGADADDAAPDTTLDDALADLAATPPSETDETSDVADVLGSLPVTTGPEPDHDSGDAGVILDDLARSGDPADPTPPVAGVEDVLAGLESVPEAGADDLDALLGDEDPVAVVADGSTPEADELDDLTDEAADPVAAPPTQVDDFSDLDDLDDLLGDAADPAGTAPPETDDLADLDDLIGDIPDPLSVEPDPEPEPEAPQPAEPGNGPDLDDLDSLLEEAPDPAAAPVMPDALPPEADNPADLDDLLGDLDVAPAQAPAAATEFAFGTLSADRPSAEALNRKRFRLAILGDFSGRGARGDMETGAALAARDLIPLDPDTVEDVIEAFATRLMLPIGKEGAAVEVPLTGLDALHPDELHDTVALFSELAGLRARLASGATAESAARELRAWGEAHDTPVAPPRRSSSGSTVPADLKLTDFQNLIGDTRPRQAEATPLDDLLARIVGPHMRAMPDADGVAMQAAVDDALTAAMRMILHHPEFQSVEAQWRSIDLIARSIEVDDTLDVVLYDVSAEEIAADLASAPDLAGSGFARLLSEAPLDAETGRGGYSALIGLYTFEETPPHADLLGRIARVAAHVDAPFLTALSPTFLETPKENRHPLVADAWDALRAMPEAGHLGLASPRFLLRRPYGAKSEPISAFKFEEFTMTEGLGGMLWANPAVLVAILLAKSYRENGASMNLGSIMSLGQMPYHVVTDRHGDQVALPCTERNLTLENVEKVMTRGVMPVVSIKGRDDIRLASFQSVAGGEILGPWSGVAPPPPSPPTPVPEAAPDDDLGLDDLLAGFDDSTEGGPAASGDDIDADLAALLEDL